MGMGDSHPTPVKHYKKTCSILHLEFNDSLIRECPHPYVQEHYGKYVSHYGCMRKKCKFLTQSEEFGGFGCSYGLGIQKRRTQE